MKLKFSWLTSRKSLISASLIDFFLFGYLFLFIFKGSISKTSIFIILNFLNTFIWVTSSYIIGRYSVFQRNNIFILLNQFLKTFLNICINTLITQILFRLFWNWNYMNFESFSNFLNDFSIFYTIIFISSSISQTLITLYLSKKFSYKKTWLFLGSFEKEKHFREIIGTETNFKFKKITQDYILKKPETAKGIVVDDDEILEKRNIQFIFEVNNIGLKFMKISNWCERYLNRYPSELVKVSDIIDGKFSYDEYSFKARVKRLIESLLSLIIILISSPIILLAAFLIKIEDGGPIFYTQIRNGFQGKKFRIIKLRTMITNAEKNGAQWADKSDRRITRIGKLLRKLRIDELPQLILVLSGEMSLIGPRPERPKIDILLRKHIPNYDLRYSIKPGISGWAQVNYPYGASIEDSKQKLSYDIYYLKNFSIFLDIMIFFKTLKLIINAKGSSPVNRKKNNK